MDNKIVYWKQFDEPIKYELFGKEQEMTGEWVCDNPIVEKAWFIGYINSKNEVKQRLEFILKDGRRNSFKVEDEVKHFVDAEQWLMQC